MYMYIYIYIYIINEALCHVGSLALHDIFVEKALFINFINLPTFLNIENVKMSVWQSAESIEWNFSTVRSMLQGGARVKVRIVRSKKQD